MFDIWTGRAYITAALCTVLAGTGTLVYQVVLWLRDDVWTSMPFSIAVTYVLGAELHLDSVSWLGLRRLMTWILNSPMSLSLILIGLLGLWIGSRTVARGYAELAAQRAGRARNR